MKTESKTPASSGSPTPAIARTKRPLIWMAVLLAVILSVLFWKSYDLDYVHYSNDGPLGLFVAQQGRMPATLTGVWTDLNWLGGEGVAPSPSFTSALLLLTTPYMYCRILQPVSLFVVGICACFCFRKLKLTPVACVLGGLAAALNSDFFSTSCWGVASQTVGFGAMYLALGLFADQRGPRRWVKVMLAGMAVGLAIMEGYDVAVLFSLFFALFMVYQTFFLSEGPHGEGRPSWWLGKGMLRMTTVVLFAFLVAAHTMSLLVGTQIKGVAGMDQDAATKKQRWPEATEWSLPRIEALQIIIPGVFGYRNQWHMYDDDQPKADQYWGLIGEDPNIQLAQEELSSPDAGARAQAANYLANPGLLWRLIGTGFYAGVPVVVLSLWAMLQAFRRDGSPYTKLQRRAIKFWLGAALISLLMSFGKYAPFYQLFYALPYSSAIRNPDKFMHVFNWALVIVFAYGVHGLAVACLQIPAARVSGFWAQFKDWRRRAGAFDSYWLTGSLAAVVAAVLGWFIYAASNPRLRAYLQTVGISAEDAPKVASFSLHAVGWFILFLALTVGLLALIFSGQFAGPRARWGGVLLGALLVIDLARADAPWIVYWDVTYKYASDPIIDFLADKPYEHRVALLPIPASTQQLALLQNAYGSHWKQHLFFYNNIECTDVVQESRVPTDKKEFIGALPLNTTFNLFRFWQLSNTRYVLGPGGDFVSKQLDPSGRQFRILKSFEFDPRVADPKTMVDFAAAPKPNGELAVIEFLGALPRARLFSNWQVTNNEATLKLLADPAFDPQQTVLVSESDAPAPPTVGVNQPAGTVEIKPNYRPKRVELDADVKVPSVLLLTDRYDPKWQVEVDGKPAKLLRCNYIMRGVYLPPGRHDVVFRFVCSLWTLYFSLTFIGLGLILAGWLVYAGDGDDLEEAIPSAVAAKSRNDRQPAAV